MKTNLQKKKERKVCSWIGLGISHSDCPHPCSSAVAESGYSSGSCSSSGLANKIPPCWGCSSSTVCTAKWHGLTKDSQVWGCLKCLSPASLFTSRLPPPPSSPQEPVAGVYTTPGAHGALPVAGDSEGDKKHIFDHFFTKQTRDV